MVNEGEGKTVIGNLPDSTTTQLPIKEDSKSETSKSKVEQKFSAETKANVDEVLKQPTQKKFLGLSKWVWFVAGAIVIFAALTVAIVIFIR